MKTKLTNRSKHYLSTEPNTTSMLPITATRSCNIKPRIITSSKQICTKSAQRIRKREIKPYKKHKKILYSPLGCSTVANEHPGKIQHHKL